MLDPSAAPRGALLARLALALLAPLLLTATAHAHGGRPQTHDILFGDAAGSVIVAPATFGVLLTRDGGERWEWLCHQAVPDARLGYTTPVALSGDGALLVSGTFGLLRGPALGCALSYEADALRDRFVTDVVTLGPSRIVALTSDAGRANALFASDDGGASFAQLGAALPERFLPERVRFAPSDPSRIYVSGVFPIEGSADALGAVLVSSDGGASWDRHELALAEDERHVQVRAVDPTAPERVWLIVQGDVIDSVRISEDGGASFRELLSMDALPGTGNRPFGLAYASDGSVWVGNTAEGLLRFAAAPSLRLSTLDKFLAVGCVVARGDEMWICADGLSDREGDGFAVGRARVEGDFAIEPVLVFSEIGPTTCEGSAATTCGPEWSDLLRDTGRESEIPDGGPPVDAASAALDGGAELGFDAGAPARPGGGGCVCGVSRADAHAPLVLSSLLVLALLRRRR